MEQPWIKLMLKDLLTSVNNPFFIILVFGSYAKEKQTINSDLDLMFILKNKNDSKEIEQAINNIHTKTKKSVHYVDINDFLDMIKNPNQFNIGNEAKKYHVILHGVEMYYEILRKIK